MSNITTLIVVGAVMFAVLGGVTLLSHIYSLNSKVMKYIRYADDFIIGVKGEKAECEQIKRQFSEFIGQTLKMELSEEKTLITHSSQYARFLGYDIRVPV